MDKRSLDVKTSRILFRENRDIVKVKQCYENVYRLMSRFPRHFSDGTYRVAYGYIDSGIPQILIRHAFLVDKNGRIVDPTIVASHEKRKEMGLDTKESWPQYYIMHLFPDIYSYTEALLRDERYALIDFMEADDTAARQWMAENNCYPIG